jgi:hypothetical protein
VGRLNDEVSNQIRLLLEEKHLYQKVKIDRIEEEGYLLHSGDPNRLWFRFRFWVKNPIQGNRLDRHRLRGGRRACHGSLIAAG